MALCPSGGDGDDGDGIHDGEKTESKGIKQGAESREQRAESKDQ
jgi:hypothetical protein